MQKVSLGGVPRGGKIMEKMLLEMGLGDDFGVGKMSENRPQDECVPAPKMEARGRAGYGKSCAARLWPLLKLGKT